MADLTGTVPAVYRRILFMRYNHTEGFHRNRALVDNPGIRDKYSNNRRFMDDLQTPQDNIP